MHGREIYKVLHLLCRQKTKQVYIITIHAVTASLFQLEFLCILGAGQIYNTVTVHNKL